MKRLFVGLAGLFLLLALFCVLCDYRIEYIIQWHLGQKLLQLASHNDVQDQQQKVSSSPLMPVTAPFAKNKPYHSTNSNDKQQSLYAVFSCSTPNGETYRSFDYAFALPLTALAWERIGFRSIVVVAGNRCEWENEPALSLVLSQLEMRQATVIFMNSPVSNRMMLSQTSRLFVANMELSPAKADDYLITSDADLWPLHKEHYLPRPGKGVVLVHGACCGMRTWKNRTFQMYPMSNIGATAATWRDVMNGNAASADAVDSSVWNSSSSDNINTNLAAHHTGVAADAESIASFLESIFGADMVRGQVHVGATEWFMDQLTVSIRLANWMAKPDNIQSALVVDDVGFSRIDRNAWDPDRLSRDEFNKRFDAHLPLKGYLPSLWEKKFKPLIRLMYGNHSWQTVWCDEYATQFLSKVHNYILFNQT